MLIDEFAEEVDHASNPHWLVSGHESHEMGFHLACHLAGADGALIYIGSAANPLSERLACSWIESTLVGLGLSGKHGGSILDANIDEFRRFVSKAVESGSVSEEKALGVECLLADWEAKRFQLSDHSLLTHTLSAESIQRFTTAEQKIDAYHRIVDALRGTSMIVRRITTEKGDESQALQLEIDCANVAELKLLESVGLHHELSVTIRDIERTRYYAVISDEHPLISEELKEELIAEHLRKNSFEIAWSYAAANESQDDPLVELRAMFHEAGSEYTAIWSGFEESKRDIVLPDVLQPGLSCGYDIRSDNSYHIAEVIDVLYSLSVDRGATDKVVWLIDEMFPLKGITLDHLNQVLSQARKHGIHLVFVRGDMKPWPRMDFVGNSIHRENASSQWVTSIAGVQSECETIFLEAN